MIKEYKTVLAEYVAEYVDKKSKFIATLRPVSTQEEATAFIEEMRAKYWDATHNVYAYILSEQNIKRYSDDGEPSGTSGVPSLKVLEGAGLLNVAVVITRYFGGTLLGTGGLVRAYSESVKKVINEAEIISKCLCDKVIVSCDYNVWGKVVNMVATLGIPTGEIIYADKVCAEIFEKVDLSDKLIENIVEKTDAICKCEKSKTMYININSSCKLIK